MPVKTVLLYGVGAIGIFALAGFTPGLAVFLMVLLIMGVLAIHANDYAQLLGSALTYANGGH